MFHKIQILPTSIQNPFLEIHPFTVVGGGGGGGKFLIIQTFFLLVYTNLLLKIPSMTGGGQPQNPIS